MPKHISFESVVIVGFAAAFAIIVVLKSVGDRPDPVTLQAERIEQKEEALSFDEKSATLAFRK